jgi:hypothetical protein
MRERRKANSRSLKLWTLERRSSSAMVFDSPSAMI